MMLSVSLVLQIFIMLINPYFLIAIWLHSSLSNKSRKVYFIFIYVADGFVDYLLLLFYLLENP